MSVKVRFVDPNDASKFLIVIDTPVIPKVGDKNVIGGIKYANEDVDLADDGSYHVRLSLWPPFLP